MKQIVLNIKDSKYRFFMELIKSLDFVQVQDDTSGSKKVDSKTKLTWNDLTDDQKNELKHIKNAFKQVDLLKQGKLKTRPVKDLLNEL
ncbi:MAG: hypothetical protein ACK5MD_06370 [Flavobacteriales bacterium]